MYKIILGIFLLTSSTLFGKIMLDSYKEDYVKKNLTFKENRRTQEVKVTFKVPAAHRNCNLKNTFVYQGRNKIAFNQNNNVITFTVKKVDLNKVIINTQYSNGRHNYHNIEVRVFLKNYVR